MPTDVKRLALPSIDEYNKAQAAVNRGYDAVEKVANRVQDRVQVYYDGGDSLDDPPTLSDLGALWVFADGLRANAAELENRADEFVQRLSELDSMREDAESERLDAERVKANG